MVKRKGSLVTKLLAVMVVCSTIATINVKPVNAATFADSLTQEQKQELADEKAKGAWDCEPGKETQAVYWGHVSADEAGKSACLNNMITGKFIGQEDYYKQRCAAIGLDYEALSGQYYAKQVSEYPQLRWGWAKNHDGKWFYSEDGTAWAKDGWKQIGGKWYYFYETGVLASNTTIGTYVINADGVWEQ